MSLSHQQEEGAEGGEEMIKYIKNFFFLMLVVLLLSGNSFAASLFQGAVNGNWSNAGNWAPAKPGAGDAVTIAATVSSLVVDETGTCLSIDMTGAAADFVLSGASGLTVAGNVTWKASSVTTQTYSGTITLTDNCTFTLNGMTLGCNVTSSTASKTLTLADALNIAAKTLTIGRGTLATGNFAITCGSFTDGAVAAAKTLTLGSSTITCTGLAFTGTDPTVNHTGTLTINAVGTQTFTFDCGAGTGWGDVTINTLPAAAATYTIAYVDGAAFTQFNISYNADRRDGVFTFPAGTMNIAESSTWRGGGVGNDDPTIRPLIRSNAIGTGRTIAMAAGTNITLTDVDVQDIVRSGDTAWTGTRVGDCGGNTNAGCSAPKTVYAVCGTADKYMNDTIWAPGSGGTPDINNYPLLQDTAIIDNSTWTDTNSRLTLSNYTSAGRFGIIDASGLTDVENITFGSAYSSIYYGSVDLSGSGITLTQNGCTFDARVAGTLTLKGFGTGTNAGNISIDSYGGTVQLASALTHTGTFTLTRGTFDLNGQTLTTAKEAGHATNTCVLANTGGAGGLVITGLTGTLFDATGSGTTVTGAPFITFTPSAAQTADITFAGGSKTYGNFTISAHAGDFDCIITGSNTFGVFTLGTPAAATWSDVQFTAGTTTIVTSFVAVGVAAHTTNIKSVTAATHILSDASGTNSVGYCTPAYSIAQGGATWNALTSGGSVDGGNNSGWTFSGTSPPGPFQPYPFQPNPFEGGPFR